MKWLQFWRNAEKARHSRVIIDPPQVCMQVHEVLDRVAAGLHQ